MNGHQKLWVSGILPLLILAGCAGRQTAFEESPARRLDAAPMAQEMETPLKTNGHGALPRVPANGATTEPAGTVAAVTRQTGDPAIPERATVSNAELYGAAFPGLNADLSRGPEAAPPQPPPAPAISPEVQQALERRLAELEAKLAELSGRPAPQPDNELRTGQATLERRLRELEVRLASAEGQAPPERESPQPVTPPELERRVGELEARLAAAETAPREAAPATLLEDARAQFEGRIREMETKLAELEGRPPQVIETTPENFEERFLDLDARLAELEGATYAEAVPAPAPAPPAAVDRHVADAMDEEYLIGAGDLLEFYSFDDENLNREITVRYDGYVSLPLVPDQRVADITRVEAEERLRTAYARVFRDPQLSLVVREPTSKTFLVMGDVATPGRYPYTRATSLVEAVTLAGGLRQRNTSSSTGGFIGVTGQLTKAFVIRHAGGEREVYEYDLRHMGEPGSHASDAQVYYGDVVYVPEGVNLVYLLGESRNPVIVELTEGMTMLQLLALSGGFDTSTARLRSVVLLRQVNTENTDVLHMNVREMLKTGRDFPLHPGDIVYIPRRRLVRLEEFVARITGSISPVIDLYLRAVDAYYINDLNRQVLEADRQNNTLRILNQLETFGSSTRNLVDLFGRP